MIVASISKVGRVLSHTNGMSLLLWSFQQHTSKSNRQLYRFSSTLTNKPELIQVLEWVSMTLVAIFPGCVKQFNSTLTKTRIQTWSSFGHLKRLPLQSWGARIELESKVLQNLSQSTAEFWKLWRGFIGCLKIIRDKSSDTGFTSARRSRFN